MTDKIDFGGKPWQALPRDMLRDPRLSPRAKGGLCCLLSHDEGWVRSCIAILQRENRCGREAAQSIMRELREAGYAELVTERDDEGRVHRHYVVYADPQVPKAGSGDFPVDGVPDLQDSRPTGAPSEVVEPLDEEPLEEEPHQETSLAPTSSSRKRDVIWDVFVECYGQPTDLNRGGWNTAAKALRDYGAEPEQIRQMIRDLHGTEKSWAVDTVPALAKYFGQRDVLVVQVRANGKTKIGERSRQLADELRRQGR